MKYFTLILLAFPFLFSGCNDDDGSSNFGALEITFTGKYANEPLVMNRTYAFGEQEIKINTAQYYLSDLTIENSNNIVGLMPIVRIVHTQDVDEATALAGVTYRIEGIPAGVYNNISFGVGVSPELNAMEPSDFENDHPLSSVGDYWDAWDSYIFSKIEGRLDTAAMNTFDLTYIYHSGKNELYQEVNMNASIEIAGEGTTALEMSVDHYELLQRNGVHLDIQAKPTAHSAGDLEYPRFILENYEKAMSITLN